VTSAKTRDVLPHGEVVGETIRSPRIFLGVFSDWRDGMETYAQANASLAPRRPWPGGTPFGWNSWGKMQFKLNYQKAVEVSDFFARELQPRGFQDDGVVYIGLDSGWNAMTDEQLKEFVNHCHANHQEAGIYLTPASKARNIDTRTSTFTPTARNSASTAASLWTRLIREHKSSSR
jgi:alpha-galactosidase